MKIAYFVHNIEDAAVLKRMEMLEQGGASTKLIGFSRFGNVPRRSSSAATVIGQSSDGKFLYRILLILACLAWPFRLTKILKGSDAILCRNLEMLALGYAVKVLSGSDAPLSYECLDIHGKLLGNGAAARTLRRIELYLMNRCQSVITSSPGFIRNYFVAVQGYAGNICLLENKVLNPGVTKGVVQLKPEAPWVIGWFGIIRCKKSLDMLCTLTEQLPFIRVIISGRVAYQEFDDFDAIINAHPGIQYTGPFTPEELPRIYGRAHFVWAIDYYEEGENSTWLLPNRLYDSLAFGAVPIALRQVETGLWLLERQAGVVIGSPLDDLPEVFESLTPDRYQILKQMTKTIPRGDIFHDQASISTLNNAVAPRTSTPGVRG